MHVLRLLTLLAVFATGLLAMTPKHYPVPPELAHAATLRRAAADTTIPDPRTRWLISLACRLPWERVDVVAAELQHIVNGCFMATAGQNGRTSSLRIECIFDVGEKAAFAPELLNVVQQLLLVTDETSACVRGALFGIIEDERVVTTAVQAPPPAQVIQTSAPWHLDRINQRTSALDGRYAYTYRGSGVVIYSGDTGIFAGHPGFGGRATLIRDFVSPPSTVDTNGHGTGTMSNALDALVGVAKNAAGAMMRVLDGNGNGYMSDVIAACMEVAERQDAQAHAAVFYLSLTGPPNSMLDAYVNDLVTTWNVPVVVAAGNDGVDAMNYSPARAANALTVAASTINDNIAGFSNRGTKPALIAPGDNVLVARSTGGYGTGSGTSFSAPMVAGALALIMEEMLPTINATTAVALLVSRARATGSVRIAGYPIVYTATNQPALPPPSVPSIPNPPGGGGDEPSIPSSSGTSPHHHPRTVVSPPRTAPPPARSWWSTDPDAPYVLHAGSADPPGTTDGMWPVLLRQMMLIGYALVFFVY